MTPESKDGHENYMPKPITSKVQLNHIMLSTEVSKTLMIFWFFPGEEKPWETINRLRYRWKRLTYETGFAMQKVNQEASPSHTAPFLRLLLSLSSCTQRRSGTGTVTATQGHRKGFMGSQSWERSRDAEQPLESWKCFESSWPGCTGKLIW